MQYSDVTSKQSYTIHPAHMLVCPRGRRLSLYEILGSRYKVIKTGCVAIWRVPKRPEHSLISSRIKTAVTDGMSMMRAVVLKVPKAATAGQIAPSARDQR